MAIIDSKGRLHGKVANFVYRTVGNTSIIQSRPARVRQTYATKESALEFGLASNCAKIIRSAFFPLTYTTDGRMVNRLNGAVLKCIKSSYGKERGERDLHDADLSHLEGFQFNRNSPLNEVLNVRPKAELDSENRVKISIPEIRKSGDLQFHEHSHGCILRMMVVALNFRENFYEYIGYKDIELTRGRGAEAQEWNPEEVLPAGSIAMVTVSLHYHGASGMLEQPVNLNSIDLSPAELLAAIKVPVIAQQKDEQASAANDFVVAKELMRFPLTDYQGAEILRKMQQIRDKIKRKPLPDKVELADSRMALPKGKVFFKKE